MADLEPLAAQSLLEKGLEQLGLRLPEDRLDQLMRYLDELIRWNKKINLTALLSREDIIIKHFVDSLTALPYLETKLGAKWIDIGTGGGFPGLVLKIAAPEIDLTLVEPSGKKVSFLHHLIGLFGMRYVSVAQNRLESLVGLQWEGNYDLVMTRALSPDLLLKQGRSLMRRGGEMLIFQGQADDIKWEERIAKYDGLGLKKIERLRLPCSEAKRALIFIRSK